MKFSRITENQTYEYIVEATKKLHEKGIECKEISTNPAVQELGLDLSCCTTSGYGVTGQGEYSALFVTSGTNGYRVFDIYIDLLAPESTSVQEVSESLGKLNPEHQQCDIRKPTSMAILYYLELFGGLPEKYKQYASHG